VVLEQELEIATGAVDGQVDGVRVGVGVLEGKTTQQQRIRVHALDDLRLDTLSTTRLQQRPNEGTIRLEEHYPE
jgi:hypothetical protein